MLGAFRQQGTIHVERAGESRRNQRLLIHRHPDVFQRDQASATASSERDSFHYTNLPGSIKGKNATGIKPLLELEWKNIRNPLEVESQHHVFLKEDTTCSRFKLD